MGLDMFLRDRKSGIELIYWRKANQIRRWFVEHLENFDFDDNLGQYDVSKEVLENLADDIEYVLSGATDKQKIERAEEVMPTCSGFFFGNTEYDIDYFLELRRTLDEVNSILEMWCDGDEVYYTEWW